jgi:hypothetical protein
VITTTTTAPAPDRLLLFNLIGLVVLGGSGSS